MIIKLIILLVINALSVLLLPLQFVNNIFGNILENTGLVALIRYSTFIFDVSVITFAIDTLVFWSSAFLLRPLVNFIRNRSWQIKTLMI